MPTKESILALVHKGMSYENAAGQLGIPAGQAYLVATGLPADGSDDLTDEERDRPGYRTGSVQALVNPPVPRSSDPEGVKRFLADRVQADAAMRDAAHRRDASPPPLELPEEEARIFDVVDVLGRDHNQVKFLLEQMKAIAGYSKGGSEADAERRQSILDLMVVALSAHEAAEEALFWPAVKEWLGPEGEQWAGQATSQEQEAKEIIAALEGKTPTEEEFDELVEELASQLRKHVALEDRVFLRVRASAEGPERVDLGRKVAKAERHGPTHAHPRAGSSPVAARLGPVVGGLDRVRDAATGRPADRKGKSSGDEAVEAS